MNKFIILFYEEGEPIDYRCIKRFLSSFPKSYTKVVTKVIEQSKTLNEDVFKKNNAILLPNFKMTRAGALKGIKIENEKPLDPNGILKECWDKIGTDLLDIKQKTKNNGRTLRELQDNDKDYVINKTSELFRRLCAHVNSKSGQIRRVGASKILFSALPEIALPVDNLEWDRVFKTKDNYKQILSTMVNEISKWEEKTKKKIDDLDINKPTTLPTVYDKMAINTRLTV